jgi:hypothetical protein
MVALELLDPPARMVPLRDRFLVGDGDEFVALPKKSAQARVDEAGLRPGRRVALGRFDGLVDQREGLVGCAFGVPGKAERRAEQGVGQRRRRALGQVAAQRLGAAEPAQHLEAERLHAGPQRGLDGLERDGARGAGANRRQRPCRQLQLAPERWLQRGRCVAGGIGR